MIIQRFSLLTAQETSKDGRSRIEIEKEGRKSSRRHDKYTTDGQKNDENRRIEDVCKLFMCAKEYRRRNEEKR
ncbi:hypothetical protein BT96DRAFT_517088 [Gymnopus androsaceus JB14]|uniref:Uncharacterized protein n=1 Tax=Gymnopus androsaceus JB14 TaxID=1447944 RepID=A0A6A4HXK1_9AGAR|nr:hypothetical protein BT96DRAFT_517088 [Gymnopus androsaceus JB14]